MLLSPLPSYAQARRTLVTFVMPQSVDPERLTITVDGFQYTNADGVAPGDNEGALIVGGTFLPPDNNGAGGLEVHGAIPNIDSGFDQVQEVVLRTNYTGGVLEAVSVVAPGFETFTPWAVLDVSVPNERIFRFLKQPGSATLNAGAFYGMFKAESDDPDFAATRFTVTGYRQIQGMVPEPGALALLAGAVTGGLLLRRRRK